MMKTKGEKPQLLTVSELLGSDPDKLSKQSIYYTIAHIHPENDLEFLSFGFFIDSIIDYALQGRFKYTLLDIFSALVQNPVLAPVYYQLDLTKIQRMRLDPRLEQIIEYYESFRPQKK